MSCPDGNRLMQWIDGELSPAEEASIASHLDECSLCQSFIATQQQIESSWRDAWVDPTEADFAAMRGGINTKKVWWQTKQSWYIAAVICAAYLGVKFFYLDGAGRPLSDIAIAEYRTPETNSESTGEQLEDSSLLLAVDEIIVPECEELEEEVEFQESPEESDQTISGEDTVEQHLMGETASVVTVSAEGSSSVGDLQSGTLPVTEEIVSSLDSPVPMEDIEECSESEILFRSVESSDSEDVSGDFASSGFVTGGATGMSGGGGTVGYGSAGLCLADESDDLQDCSQESDIINSTSATSEPRMEAPSISTGFSVSLVLSGEEAVQVVRSDWISLYTLIDSLLAENHYYATDTLIFRVNSDGVISSKEDIADAVIDIPEAAYADCTVSVVFH